MFLSTQQCGGVGFDFLLPWGGQGRWHGGMKQWINGEVIARSGGGRSEGFKIHKSFPGCGEDTLRAASACGTGHWRFWRRDPPRPPDLWL